MINGVHVVFRLGENNAFTVLKINVVNTCLIVNKIDFLSTYKIS